jgi:hypothetical protein
MILRAVLVFLAAGAADVCWARYVGHVGDGSRWRAATWAAVLFALGSFSVVEYTSCRWLLVPAVAGAFVGTAVGVRAATRGA